MEVLRMALGNTAACLGDALATYNRVVGQEVFKNAETPAAPSAIRAQGPCETTLTPRFEIKDCACGTYEGNLGPCLTWNEGNEVGRCVFCAHGLDCHVKLSKLLASEKHQDDPKNANLAALVLKLDKHISLHEMFAPEWEAIAAAARIAMDRTGAGT